MKLSPKSVLITGTTSGLGHALLEHYARRGARVIAVNRRRVLDVESSFPAVRFECLDVREEEQVAELISRLAKTGELPEVFILNAGINLIDNDESFQLASYREVLDTNLYGVLNFIAPLIHMPVTQLPRHLIAISSMANYVGNPYGLGYFTSKRALTASFDVWSQMYAGTDLVFQQVMLGPIRTSIYTMADKLPAWMVRIKNLFSASSETSAHAIARLAKTRRRKLFYPWQAVPLYLGIALAQLIMPSFFRGKKTLSGIKRRPDLSPNKPSPMK